MVRNIHRDKEDKIMWEGSLEGMLGYLSSLEKIMRDRTKEDIELDRKNVTEEIERVKCEINVTKSNLSNLKNKE